MLSHNLEVARSLHPSNIRPENLTANTPNLTRPFGWAYFSWRTASPSVDGRVSNLHPPLIFWAWGEMHAPFVSQVLPGGPDCPDGMATLSMPSPATLNGSMIWQLDSQTVRQSLRSGSGDPAGPAPFSDAQWQALATQEGPNHTAVLPELTVSFQGTVQVNYTYFARYYEAQENVLSGHSGGAIAKDVLCHLVEVQEERAYAYPVQDERLWQVEYGEPQWVLLQPAGNEQLSWRPQAQVAILANRQQERTVFKAADGEHASDESTYENQTDAWGLITLVRNESGAYENNHDSSLFSDASFGFLRPAALDAQNRAFAWQFYHHLWADLPPGWSDLTARFEDEFTDGWDQTWRLDTRAGSGIAMTADGPVVVSTDNRTMALRPSPNRSTLGVEGSDKIRPSQTSVAEWGVLPALAVVLPLAVVALIGYGILTRREKD